MSPYFGDAVEMTTQKSPTLDISAEEERFLRTTFRRHARSYLTLSLIALVVAVTALGFGYQTASARVDSTEITWMHAEHRKAIESLKVELATFEQHSLDAARKLEALEQRIERSDDTPGVLSDRLDGAYARIDELEAQQIESDFPVDPQTHRRLTGLETRLSVLELGSPASL